jgi:lipoprotein-anchoring transpeptidase ErfK/SrfK
VTQSQQTTVLRAALAIAGVVVVAVLAMAVTGMLGSDPIPSANARTIVVAPRASTGAADQGDGTAVTSTPTGPQIAVIEKRTGLYSKPDGKRIKTLATKTEWNNPRVVPIIEQKGDWLRVLVSDLPNGRSGWIKREGTQVGGNDFHIVVDISKRHITVTQAGKVVRRITAAVGEQGTPTPTGDFAVTDRINFTDQGSVYGCCALALSAHQTRTAPGWTGSDRVAIHATPSKGSIGNAATNGCMRVGDDDASWLMTTIPMGTIVDIRA